jgi:hypothetical protein
VIYKLVRRRLAWVWSTSRVLFVNAVMLLGKVEPRRYLLLTGMLS